VAGRRGGMVWQLPHQKNGFKKIYFVFFSKFSISNVSDYGS